jgi:thiamine pyrophosphokinase
MSRIVIFANGILTDPDRLRSHLHPSDRIFCANGGTEHALSLDLRPEVIIGDLDSLSAELVSRMEAEGAAIHRYPAAKDQTDLELAFQQAMVAEPDEILLVTALGKRLDQMLANILLLTRPEYASAQLTLVDGAQWVTLLRPQQHLTVNGQPGDTLSLIPMTTKVKNVNLTGVAWPLEQATLSLGSTLSISNQLAGHQAGVLIGEGMVLLVHIDKSYEEK